MSCFACFSSGQKHGSIQPELAGPLSSNQLGIKSSPQKASNPKAASASSSLNRSSSGKTVSRSPGSGISCAGGGAVSSTAMTGSGMRKSRSGAANVSNDRANSSSGITSISGGMAATSNGSRGGMAVQTDGGSGSNAGTSSTARQGSAQATAKALPVDTSKFPVKVWPFLKAWLSAMKPNQDAPGRCCSTQRLQQSKIATSSSVITAQFPVSTCCTLPGPSRICWPSQFVWHTMTCACTDLMAVSCLYQLSDTLQVFRGPSLLDGDFNEDDSHASFADALSSWRGKAPAQAQTTTGPNAAPGTCTYH